MGNVFEKRESYYEINRGRDFVGLLNLTLPTG
jgi:hypothetical protein